MTDFLATTNPDDLWNMLRRMQAEIDELKLRNVSFGDSSEAMDRNDLDLRVEAEDGTVRGVMSAINLYDEFGVNAYFLGRDPDGNPTIWIDFDTGKVYLTSVGFNGTTLNDALVSLLQEGFIIYQQMTDGSETRVLRLGLQDNVGVIDFYEPTTPVTIPNYGFEDGDLGDWTTGGTSVTWTADTLNKHSGSYAAKCVFASTGSNPTIENAARFEVNSGSICNFSLYTYLATATHVTLTLTMQVKFYDALTGGSLVSTETIGTRTSGVIGTPSPWSETVKKLTVPATATHAVFYVAGDIDYSISSSFSLDDFTVTPVSGSQLALEDLDITYTPVGGVKESLTNPRIVYAKSAAVNFTTTETTVFDISTPDGFFSVGRLNYEYGIYYDVTTARTLTLRTYFNGSVIKTESIALALNTSGFMAIRVFTGGTFGYSQRSTYNSAGTSAVVNSGNIGLAPVAGGDTIKVTLQLSGTATYMFFEGVVVSAIKDADLW